MKRIIGIMMCAVMLCATVLTVSTSADVTEADPETAAGAAVTGTYSETLVSKNMKTGEVTYKTYYYETSEEEEEQEEMHTYDSSHWE
ncbi:MAG: hypothetical protein LUH43_05290 [Clostridia bacterium]|nr:hypothetical protein [Clostridia bacterium]